MNIIYLYGSFDAYMSTSICAQLDALKARGEKEVTIKIKSYGGNVNDYFQIKDAVKNFCGTVDMEVEGYAASCAAYLLCDASGVVKAHEHAMIMFHEVQRTPAAGSQESRSDVQNTSNYMNKSQDVLSASIKRKTNLSDAEVHKLVERDNYLFASEAKDLGIIDEIISNESETQDDLMKEKLEALRKQLGLSEKATEDEILAKAAEKMTSDDKSINSLKEEVESLEEQVTAPPSDDSNADEDSDADSALKAENAKLKSENAKIKANAEKSQKEALIEAHVKKKLVAPSAKDALMALNLTQLTAQLAMAITPLDGQPHFEHKDGGQGEKLTAEDEHVYGLLGLDLEDEGGN